MYIYIYVCVCVFADLHKELLNSHSKVSLKKRYNVLSFLSRIQNLKGFLDVCDFVCSSCGSVDVNITQYSS